MSSTTERTIPAKMKARLRTSTSASSIVHRSTGGRRRRRPPVLLWLRSTRCFASRRSRSLGLTLLTPSTYSPPLPSKERRGEDSNLRRQYLWRSGLRGRCIYPLCHLSNYPTLWNGIKQKSFAHRPAGRFFDIILYVTLVTPGGVSGGLVRLAHSEFVETK